VLEVLAKKDAGHFYDKSILNDGVEFIGLINKHGKMEDVLSKNEINLSQERIAMFSMELRLQSSMQSDFDPEFGPVSYTLTEREELKFVSILVFPYIILAIMKKGIDHTSMIDKIKNNIANFKNKT
jgi:hypothetical protein